MERLRYRISEPAFFFLLVQARLSFCTLLEVWGTLGCMALW